jgi:UDP-N-acetylmuramoylalanine--D-glutamate ligase
MNSKTYTVIVGLGVTGLACAEFLSTLGDPFVVVDSRENPPKWAEFKLLFPEVKVFTGGFPAEILSKADRLILSPGISIDHPELVKILAPEVEIIGDIELFARSVTKPVIAITGSNGKSTVTTLVGEMAKAAGIKVGIGGNLGTPALKLLREMPDLYVLELSSFQLETTYSLKPLVSTVLNISPDHLDRYPTVAAYRLAKCRVFNHCQQVVINREDPIGSSHLNKNDTEDIPMISYGLDIPSANNYGLIQQNGQDWIARGTVALLPTTKVKLFGRHNIANVLAALALGECAKLPIETMLSVLQTFTGLPHRCEKVREYKGVQWINDSKGTNVGATVSALQGLAKDIPGKWVLIAGGVGKNADFTPLSSLISKYCRAVILIGEAADELQRLFKNIAPCIRADSLEEAVKIAAFQAKVGDGVLLSPACASLDMFINFEDRGNTFKKAVQNL